MGYRDAAAIPFFLSPGTKVAVELPPTLRRTESLALAAVGPPLEGIAAPLAHAHFIGITRLGALAEVGPVGVRCCHHAGPNSASSIS